MITYGAAFSILVIGIIVLFVLMGYHRQAIRELKEEHEYEMDKLQDEYEHELESQKNEIIKDFLEVIDKKLESWKKSI